jgi:hypothetical protein
LRDPLFFAPRFGVASRRVGITAPEPKTVTASPTSPAPCVTRTASAFRLRYAVVAAIHASSAEIWKRLTDAAAFPQWNTTVTSIEGQIAQGQRLAIKVPVAPKQVFKVVVELLEPERRMVWSSGFFPMFHGSREFTLTPRGETTEFAMSETFRGAMLPMIKRALPDFAPVFAQYAADLQRACERA